jgi:YrbI family 3-deoxy-D-manno-octulosonate 8-phosphate phosphatase
MKQLYNKLPTILKKKLQNIKLLILDFDGTLTDNRVITDQTGKESVICNRSDGLGLEILRKQTNVKVIILSKETNSVIAARAKKLKIPCTHGIGNKIKNFNLEVKKHKVKPSEICFVGNDLNDIECIQAAGIGVAVSDAFPQVLKAADYITNCPGGDGAVREICEFIMYAKNKHPYP